MAIAVESGRLPVFVKIRRFLGQLYDRLRRALIGVSNRGGTVPAEPARQSVSLRVPSQLAGVAGGASLRDSASGRSAGSPAPVAGQSAGERIASLKAVLARLEAMGQRGEPHGGLTLAAVRAGMDDPGQLDGYRKAADQAYGDESCLPQALKDGLTDSYFAEKARLNADYFMALRAVLELFAEQTADEALRAEIGRLGTLGAGPGLPLSGFSAPFPLLSQWLGAFSNPDKQFVLEIWLSYLSGSSTPPCPLSEILDWEALQAVWTAPVPPAAADAPTRIPTGDPRVDAVRSAVDLLDLQHGRGRYFHGRLGAKLLKQVADRRDPCVLFMVGDRKTDVEPSLYYRKVFAVNNPYDRLKCKQADTAAMLVSLMQWSTSIGRDRRLAHALAYLRECPAPRDIFDNDLDIAKLVQAWIDRHVKPAHRQAVLDWLRYPGCCSGYCPALSEAIDWDALAGQCEPEPPAAMPGHAEGDPLRDAPNHWEGLCRALADRHIRHAFHGAISPTTLMSGTGSTGFEPPGNGQATRPEPVVSPYYPESVLSPNLNCRYSPPLNDLKLIRADQYAMLLSLIHLTWALGGDRSLDAVLSSPSMAQKAVLDGGAPESLPVRQWVDRFVKEPYRQDASALLTGSRYSPRPLTVSLSLADMIDWNLLRSEWTTSLDKPDKRAGDTVSHEQARVALFVDAPAWSASQGEVYAYLFPGVAGRQTAWFHLAQRQSGVRALLFRQEIAAAVRRDDPVRLKACLLGMLPDTPATLGLDIAGLIRMAQRHADARLADYLEHYPHVSEGDVELNLNGKAEFHDGKTTKMDSAKIVCRHLAAYFAELGGKPALKDFQTTRSISAAIGHDWERRHLRMTENNPKAYYFRNDRLGDLVRTMVKQMSAEGKTQKRLIIHSSNHAMALVIQRHAEGYELAFYDPNRTAVCLEMKFADPATVQLDIGDLVSIPHHNLYYAYHLVGITGYESLAYDVDSAVLDGDCEGKRELILCHERPAELADSDWVTRLLVLDAFRRVDEQALLKLSIDWKSVQRNIKKLVQQDHDSLDLRNLMVALTHIPSSIAVQLRWSKMGGGLLKQVMRQYGIPVHLLKFQE
ncbi:ShET2/EspL2 family type III secretion system effector toxin [Paludibacterium paludis]|uniref:ShET2 enterotoxin N-terminal domain-containing protein n=1 Tax=Paludibacterium paludis TaxID=1225769 RepID=A0A918U9M5_9NEIS|nr:ShET2/EspL2 family type III secretion system effector toxin [Paludibacterium paludis]GGY12616.1 hypothetical protein GCM10011289_14860 [Paludibacterium paludis]